MRICLLCWRLIPAVVVVVTAALLSKLPAVFSWPEGTFGLPMPKTGCPVGSISEWETGTRTHITEKGSHASDNVHLAGIDPAPAEHIVQLFCMKMFYPQEDDYKWMPGKYCIFKKGDCPSKFQEGFILWDDAASWYGRSEGRQTSKGVLPDGDYNYNTKIFYCCRTDGSPYAAIKLPSAAPFYLLQYGEICQEVEGMTVTEEWVYWSDEKSFNLNYHGGVYPKVIRSQVPRVYTKLFYCYYQTKPPSQAYQIVMTTVYVVAGVVGVTIIICVVVGIISRLCRGRRKHAGGDGSPVAEHRAPVQPAPNGAAQVYRYVTLQTNDEPGGGAEGERRPMVPSAPPDLSAGANPSNELTVILKDQDFRPLSLPPSYDEVVGQQKVIV